MDHITILRNTYKELGDIRNKLRFFELCQKSGIIPSGLSLCFNLALGVNDSDLITKIEKILDIASSDIMDTLIHYCAGREVEVEEDFNKKREQVDDNRLVSIMKREVNFRKQADLQKMEQKLQNLKGKIILPEIFTRSSGSRRLRGRFYRPFQSLRIPAPNVRALRQHRRRRRGRPEQLRRRRLVQRRNREGRRREEEERILEVERGERGPVNESRVQLTPDQIEVARLTARLG